MRGIDRAQSRRRSLIMKRLWMAVWVPVLSAQIVPGKYIVELAGPPAADTAALQPIGKREAAARARSIVLSEQARVLPRLANLGARVVAGVDTVANAFIVEISDNDAPRLAAEPGVARVIPVPLMHSSLDHALPLIKAPEAWSIAGGISQAGAGVKIGIIDSGITATHPGFQDDSLPVPDGFPLVNNFSDTPFTNNKIIVARNYVTGSSARDQLGHGTAVAMAAAGVTNAGPLATITGVAPKAWLGSYKVNDQLSFEAGLLLKALDDAVKDGMDIINISAGVAVSSQLDRDPLVAAVERASALGVVVVLAAGNEGPSLNTIDSPASAPSAIAVGASENDRMFVTASIQVDGVPAYLAQTSTGPKPASSITGRLMDVTGVDPTGEACAPLPPGSLTGAVALIVRSPRTGNPCSFELKLMNAQNAGALAAVVYMNPDSPELVIMNVGAAALPAVSVDGSAGLELRRRLLSSPGLSLTIQFGSSPLFRNPNLITSFSSRGPNVDLRIKPDLVAVGDYLYLATQKVNSSSELYDGTGYLTDARGTSFSAPLVAGAAAVLKAARAGFTAAQYRSLVVNSATPIAAASGALFPLQSTGTGLLNIDAALHSTVAVSPVSIGFGSGAAAVDVRKTLSITNLAAVDDTFTLWITPMRGVTPVVENTSVRIAAGESQDLAVRLALSAPLAGVSEGYVHIRSTRSDVDTIVPYWYAATDQQAFDIPILSAPTTGRTGSLQRINFRVVDRSGVPLFDTLPAVRVINGEGTVSSVTRNDFSFQALIRLGLGANTFAIEAGPASVQVSIQAQ